MSCISMSRDSEGGGRAGPRLGPEGSFVVSQRDSVLKPTSSVSRADERKPLSHNEIRRSRIPLGEREIGP